MGWIAIAAVALEAIGLAVGLVVWGWPALIIVGPLLLGTVIATVVLWLTVAPRRMLRAHVEGVSPGALGGRRAAEDVRRVRPGSGPGADPGASGSAWPSDAGFAAEHATHHGWHSPSDSGWSGGGGSSDSWSDSTSSGSSDSSSSSSSDSSW